MYAAVAVFLYLLIRSVTEAGSAEPGSRWRIVALGLLLGAMTATRALPILLLPAVALLFVRLFGWKRRVMLDIALMSTVTGLAVLGALAANYERFGRVELANSAGRHLWQSVKPFATEALEGTPEFSALEALNPRVDGTDWFRLVLPPAERQFAGEGLLERLSVKAIRREPLKYLGLGAARFVGTVFRAPYQLGNYAKGDVPLLVGDPLHTQAMLPPPSRVVLHLPRLIQRVVNAGVQRVYRLFTWIYAPLVAAVILIPLALQRHPPPSPWARPLYGFLAWSFFGLLWISWQIEDANTRNVIPYLPALGLMAGLAMTELSAVPRKRTGEGTR
jgi:hypothetical protein